MILASTLALVTALTGVQPELTKAPVDRIPRRDYYCLPIDKGSIVQMAVFHSDEPVMIIMGQEQKGYVDSKASGYLDMFSTLAQDGSGDDDLSPVKRTKPEDNAKFQELQKRFFELVTMAADAIQDNRCIEQ